MAKGVIVGILSSYMAASAAHPLEEDGCHCQRKKTNLLELKKAAGAAFATY
jgi:hypothetical protein